MRKKLPVYPINGLPVLPEGLHWNVNIRTNPNSPVELTINRGAASRNGYSGYSDPVAETVVPEAWHWRVRLAARRLYRKTFDADGNIIERKPKPVERFEDRYSPVAVYNSLQSVD